MDNNSRRVLQLNMRKSRHVVDELALGLTPGTIIACQEPPFVQGRVPGLPQCAKCVYKKGPTRPLAAIIVCGDDGELMAHYQLCTETVAVASVGRGSETVFIISAYCPPRRPILPILHHIETVIAAAHGRAVACVDSNAWSPTWGSGRYN